MSDIFKAVLEQFRWWKGGDLTKKNFCHLKSSKMWGAISSTAKFFVWAQWGLCQNSEVKSCQQSKQLNGIFIVVFTCLHQICWFCCYCCCSVCWSEKIATLFARQLELEILFFFILENKKLLLHKWNLNKY